MERVRRYDGSGWRSSDHRRYRHRYGLWNGRLRASSARKCVPARPMGTSLLRAASTNVSAVATAARVGSTQMPSAPAWLLPILPDGSTLFGNTGQGIILGPPQFNFDISILKNFRISERQSIQFRTEFFNAFNHPQFLPPGNQAPAPGGLPAELNVNSPASFGQINELSVSPRVLQFASEVHLLTTHFVAHASLRRCMRRHVLPPDILPISCAARGFLFWPRLLLAAQIPPGRLALLRPRSRRHQIFSARSNHSRQRRETRSRVDFRPKVDPTTRQPGDPCARGAPSATSAATPIVVDGVMYLPAGSAWWRSTPRPARKSGATRFPPASPPSAASPTGPATNKILRASCSPPARKLVALNANTGKIDPGFGNEGQVDMVVPYSGVPTIYKNVVMLGATRWRNSHRAAGRFARLRCPHRREALGVSFRPAARRNRPRDLAQRRLERPLRRQRLGLVHDRGRAARHRLHDLRRPGGQLLGRRSPGRESVRQFRGRRGCRKPASTSGIFKPCITTCGIPICRPRRA